MNSKLVGGFGIGMAVGIYVAWIIVATVDGGFEPLALGAAAGFPLAFGIDYATRGRKVRKR